VPHPSFDDVRRTVEAALDLGDEAAAVAALRAPARWLAAEHGSEFRALVARLSDDAWRDDAVLASAIGASYRSADSPPGRAALAYFAAAEVALSGRDDSADPDRVTVGLAHAAALRGLGQLDAARHLLSRTEALGATSPSVSVPQRVELAARTALESGMLALFEGELTAARERLEFARGLPADHLTRAERLEALGGLAVTDYLYTGLAQAEAHYAEARELAGDSSLWQTGYAAPALAAAALVSIERHDLDGAEALEVELMQAASATEWEPFAFVVAGYRRLALQRFAEALDELSRARQGLRAWEPPGLALSSAEVLKGTVLVALDRGDEAWSVLRAVSPHEHHALCPARIVALLRFRHGDLRGARDALRDCEALGDDHSPRTLVEVRMLRAAIEYESGEFDLSDVLFDRGLAAIARSGSRAPLRLIPPGTLARLAARALTRPHGDEVERILGRIAEATQGIETAIEPLSHRELLVLAEVEKGSTVAGIAAALFISPNTVKTHLRRLYRKLGVATRSDAIRKAKSLGLGRTVTRESPE
jgi:LuxR family transcriptional regulator, maltose regulon positive regulatory protein